MSDVNEPRIPNVARTLVYQQKCGSTKIGDSTHEIFWSKYIATSWKDLNPFVWRKSRLVKYFDLRRWHVKMVYVWEKWRMRQTNGDTPGTRNGKEYLNMCVQWFLWWKGHTSTVHESFGASMMTTMLYIYISLVVDVSEMLSLSEQNHPDKNWSNHQSVNWSLCWAEKVMVVTDLSSHGKLLFIDIYIQIVMDEIEVIPKSRVDG